MLIEQSIKASSKTGEIQRKKKTSLPKKLRHPPLEHTLDTSMLGGSSPPLPLREVVARLSALDGSSRSAKGNSETAVDLSPGSATENGESLAALVHALRRLATTNESHDTTTTLPSQLTVLIPLIVASLGSVVAHPLARTHGAAALVLLMRDGKQPAGSTGPDSIQGPDNLEVRGPDALTSPICVAFVRSGQALLKRYESPLINPTFLASNP